MFQLHLKSVFSINNERSFYLMKKFIKHEMKVEIFESTICRRKELIVPLDDYENVLLEGQKYALEKN